MDSDVPQNEAGRTDTETGGKVLPFRGGWFDSPDELVPIGPRSRLEKDTAADRGHAGAKGGEPVASREPPAPEGSTPAGHSRVVADDFWGGLADARDLIQFPAAASVARGSIGPSGSLASRRRRVWLGAAVAVLGFVVIGLRLSDNAGNGALQPGAALAQTALSIAKLPVNETGVDQQTMRGVSLQARLSAQARKPRPHVTRHPAASRTAKRVLVSQTRSSSGHSQPAVYSPAASAPPTPTAPAPPSRSTSSSSESGGGGGGGGGRSAGGGSNGGGSHRSGPSGRGAAFGPGKMGG